MKCDRAVLGKKKYGEKAHLPLKKLFLIFNFCLITIPYHCPKVSKKLPGRSQDSQFLCFGRKIGVNCPPVHKEFYYENSIHFTLA